MQNNDKEKIKEFISDYMRENPNASSRDISDAVYDSLGIRVSHVTIQAILIALGYIARRWVREAGQ